jgi:hypothetical protein
MSESSVARAYASVVQRAFAKAFADYGTMAFNF